MVDGRGSTASSDRGLEVHRLSPRDGALGVDPGVQVVAAVEDAAAEAEAARAGAQVSPVPQGGDGGAQQFGGFGDGEQLGLVAGWRVGHGWLRV